MLFAGELLWLNLLSLAYAVSLSWYFGGTNIYLHPDRLIASVVSYGEKSIYRKGTFKEGLLSMLLTIAVVFAVTSMLLYFTKNAGGVWYFIFSTAIIYFSITARFSTYEQSSSTLENYLNYAMPIIFYSLILGPVASLIYRIFPISTTMTPVKVDKFADYGKPARQTYILLRDSACLIIPFIMWITSVTRFLVKKLKSYRP